MLLMLSMQIMYTYFIYVSFNKNLIQKINITTSLNDARISVRLHGFESAYQQLAL